MRAVPGIEIKASHFHYRSFTHFVISRLPFFFFLTSLLPVIITYLLTSLYQNTSFLKEYSIFKQISPKQSGNIVYTHKYESTIFKVKINLGT